MGRTESVGPSPAGGSGAGDSGSRNGNVIWADRPRTRAKGGVACGARRVKAVTARALNFAVSRSAKGLAAKARGCQAQMRALLIP